MTAPVTERGLIKLVTHVECGSCSLRRPVTESALEKVDTIDELVYEDGGLDCCDEVSAYFFIVSSKPLFPGVPELDDACELRRVLSAPSTWEYLVDHDLAEDLGLVS